MEIEFFYYISIEYNRRRRTVTVVRRFINITISF